MSPSDEKPPTPLRRTISMQEETASLASQPAVLLMQLPPAVLGAGKRTTLSFFLGQPSFVRRLRWVPGFRLEKLVIGMRDFGDGTAEVDGKYYYGHRVLKGDPIFLHILNTSNDDRAFSGSMTVEPAPVDEPHEYECSLDAPEVGEPPTLTVNS